MIEQIWYIVPPVNIETGQIDNSAVGHVPLFGLLSYGKMYSTTGVHNDKCEMKSFTMRQVSIQTRVGRKTVQNAKCHFVEVSDENLYSTPPVIVDTCKI